MISGRCPICSKGYEIASLADLPAFPFCTERCRLIDLGRWVDSRYVIPPKPASEQDEAEDEEPLAEAEQYEE